MARTVAESVGQGVLLARANLGLSRRAAARLAGVSGASVRHLEDGAPSVAIDTACRIASALGLKLWVKAFPVGEPRLRDSGQLGLAERLRQIAHAAYRFEMEHHLGNGRAVDVVLFGAVEIIAIEIIRALADFQAQYRSALAKRDVMAERHQRPVRLVLAVSDTRRNRAVVREHSQLVTQVLPAGSRRVLGVIRAGTELGSDGVLWLRAR